MSNDLFGMAVESRMGITYLMIVSLRQFHYYPLVEAARNFIPALLFDNLHLISLDKTLINGLLVCKHCHMLFTDTRWNRPVFLKHLTKFHDVERKEPIPEPTTPKKSKNKPIQFTDTPITINLIEPNTEVGVAPTESGKLKEEVAKVADAATQTVAYPSTQSLRKTHHKKKIPLKVEPICLDTIYDNNYVPATPIPVVSEIAFEDLDWEAPLKKKATTRKRKAGAPEGQKEAKLSEPEQTHNKKPRKARKRPMVDTKAKAGAQKKEVAHEVRKEDLQAALLAEADALPRSSPHAHARKELGW